PSNQGLGHYGQLPLSFEVNQGQVTQPVRFLARGHSYAFFLSPTEVLLRWKGNVSRLRTDDPNNHTLANSNSPSTFLHLKLTGANRCPRLGGLDPLPGKSHYLIGNEPHQWKTHIQTYAKVRYEEVYPGVDMVFYGHGQQLEYDFLLSPGADPKAIRL